MKMNVVSDFYSKSEVNDKLDDLKTLFNYKLKELESKIDVYKKEEASNAENYRCVKKSTQMFYIIDYIDKFCKDKGYIVASVFHTHLNEYLTNNGIPTLTPQQIKIVLECLNYHSKTLNGNRTYSF